MGGVFMYDKEAVTRLMNDGGTFLVKFFKVDGTERIMLCTTDFKTVAEQSKNYVAPRGVRKVPNSQMIVWDLEKDAWRSFRPKSIIEFTKISDEIIRSWNPKIGMNINELIYRLSKEDLWIKFIKADNSIREMNCTRQIGKYPKLIGPVFKVYDIDKEDFRNINFNRILEVKKSKKKHKGTTRRLADKVRDTIKKLIAKFRGK